MEEIIEKLKSIEFDHQSWSRELLGMLEEIKFYEHRVAHLVDGTDDEESLSQLGVLVKGFDELKTSVNGLYLKVKAHVLDISQRVASNGHFEEMIDSDHLKTMADMEDIRIKEAALKERVHRLSKSS